MVIALRACLFVSAAAGLTACVSNPPVQAAAIDYRAADPEAQVTRHAPQPRVFADTTLQPVAPKILPPTSAPSDIEPPPYQLVADLGPSTGVPAVAEAKGMAAENGARPGGARRVAMDDPSARAIEVQPRDTLYDISRRYNVNLRALIETNRLEPPYALDVGAVVFLPPPNVHVVEKGETLYAVSRRYNVDTRSLALLNGMARPWTVWPGDELLLPPLARDQARDAKPIAIAPVAAPPVQVASKPAPKTPSIKPPEAKPIAAIVTPAPVLPSTNGPISLASGSGSKAVKAEPKPPVLAEPPPPRPEVKPAPPQPSVQAPALATGKATPKGGNGEFIWPVAGQVLKGFGPAANGQRNDGVNISASKGADVVAAAGGEVVYAGSELAGFGNLVLIRHPGGWVTAYAHADSILVTEGDLVRQGQVVAKAGSTGNAGSPQVHFELRKGKEPVDPTLHLPALRG